MAVAVTGKPAAFFGALCGGMLGFLFLKTLPLAERHPVFLLALPLMCLLALGFVLQPRSVVALVILVRSLLDPVLNLTRAEGSSGFGAVLNLAVVLMTAALLLRAPGVFRSGIVRLWALFLFFGAVSTALSPSPPQSLRLLFNLISYFCMFLLPSLMHPGENDKKFWIGVLLASTVLPVVAADLDLVRGGRVDDESAGARVYGTFTHPNILAFYLLWVLALLLYVRRSALFRWGGFLRLGLGLFALNVVGLLLATKTRNAWIGAWFFFFIYGLLKDRRYAAGCLALAGATLLLPPIASRLNDLYAYSTHRLNSFAWRLEVWRLSLGPAMERWAFGHGLDSFKDLSGAFVGRNPLVSEEGGVYAHNVYLQLWFETGLAGLLAYLAIFWKMIAVFAGRMKRAVSLLSQEYAVILAYTLVYAINSFADNMLSYLTVNWYCWFLWGVLWKAMRFQRYARIVTVSPASAMRAGV